MVEFSHFISPFWIKRKMVPVKSPIPSLTFQLFIYENLSARYHYPIKRTRDVKKRVISLFSLLITI